MDVGRDETERRDLTLASEAEELAPWGTGENEERGGGRGGEREREERERTAERESGRAAERERERERERKRGRGRERADGALTRANASESTISWGRAIRDRGDQDEQLNASCWCTRSQAPCKCGPSVSTVLAPKVQ